MSLILSDAEVDALCAPLTQPAAQVRYLRAELGLVVKVRPNGRAIVSRAALEAVLGGSQERPAAAPIAAAPDVAGLMRHLRRPQLVR